MLLTIDFSNDMYKTFTKKYLLDFLSYSLSLLREEYPDIKLEISSPPILADINISVLEKGGILVGYFKNFDDHVRNEVIKHAQLRIGRQLQHLWTQYIKVNPL